VGQNCSYSQLPAKPQSHALKLKTLEEAFTSVCPQLSHLRVIGCVAYCHVPTVKRTKLDSKALVTILLGYDEDSRSYRCWDPASRHIVLSCDIGFDESRFDPKNLSPIEALTDSFTVPILPSFFQLPSGSPPLPLEPNILPSKPTPLPAPQSSSLDPPLSDEEPPSPVHEIVPATSPSPPLPLVLLLRRSTRIR
jgi:hypothetical protein